MYNDLNLLYRWVIVHNVMNCIVNKLEKEEKLNVILDKRLPRSQRKEFRTYAELKGYHISRVSGDKNIFYRNRLNVDHRNSIYEPCIQAADFISGAAYHLYEHKNNAYYKIIYDKIEEFIYWP